MIRKLWFGLATIAALAAAMPQTAESATCNPTCGSMFDCIATSVICDYCDAPTPVMDGECKIHY